MVSDMVEVRLALKSVNLLWIITEILFHTAVHYIVVALSRRLSIYMLSPIDNTCILISSSL